MATLLTKKACVINFESLLNLTSQSLDKQYTLSHDILEDERLMEIIDFSAIAPLAEAFDKIFFSYRTGKAIALINFDQGLMQRGEYKNFYIYSPGTLCENFKHISSSFVALRHTKKNLHAMLDNAVPAGECMAIAGGILLSGLDVSMSNTGVACIQDRSGIDNILIGSFSTKPGENDFIRGQDAGNNLSPMLLRGKSGKKYLANMLSCNNIAIEGGALNATHGAYRLGRYCGMLMANFNITSITEIPPTSLKKFITGYGRSDKAVVTKFLCEKLGLDQGFILNDDESDALALLYCQLHIDEYLGSRSPKKKKTKKRSRAGNLPAQDQDVSAKIRT